MIEKSRAGKDLIILTILTTLAWVVAATTDLCEAVIRWANDHEQWQIDEILILSMFMTACLAVFSTRRWLDYRRGLTNQVQAETALRVSEERLRMAMQATQDGVWDWDLKTGRVFRSPRYFSMLGYDEEEFTGTFGKWQDLVHPEDTETVRRALDDYVKGENKNYEVEFRMLSNTGEPVWILCRGRAVAFDEKGNPLRIEGTHTDITGRKETEFLLQQAERRYRRLFERAPAMYVVTRKERGGAIVRDCNELFLIKLGYAKEEVVGRPLEEFYSQASADQLIESGGYAKALSGQFFIGERELKKRDGTLIPSLLYTVPEEDSRGQVIGTFAHYVDITERKNLEHEVRATYESFTSIVEGSRDGIVVVGPNGTILYANPSAESLFARGRDELVGSPLGIPSVQDLSEISLLDSHGSLLVAEMRASRTTWHGQQTWMLLFRNVTERKRYEEALKSSEERLRLVIEASPIGISITQEGLLKYANPSFLDMLGYETMEEVEGMRVEALYDEAEGNLFGEEEQICPDEGKAACPFLERRAVTKTGDTIDLHVWVRQIQYEGKTSLLRFFLDVSQEETLRAQLLQSQKMEAIGTLAGGIAHDFNNIIYTITGYTELALEDLPPGSPSHAELERVLSAAKRAADMVARILAFSRRNRSERKPVVVEAVVQEALKFLRGAIPSTVEIREKIGSNLGSINGDSTQLHQVLMNLCANAAYAMGSKPGVLSVEVEAVELTQDFTALHAPLVPGPHVVLSVSDTGTGIPPEIIDRIFEPYFTTKPTGEGTGFGLSLLHGIVKSHGGAVTVKSEVGKGTTFEVFLPMINEAAGGPEEAAALSQPTGNEVVLLVDDEQIIAEMEQTILKRLGYLVVSKTNPLEALETFREEPHKYDIVITDLTMPKMTGTELAGALKTVRPQVPIILCTGFSEKLSPRELELAGVTALVKKPMSKNDVAGAIRHVLDKSH